VRPGSGALLNAARDPRGVDGRPNSRRQVFPAGEDTRLAPLASQMAADLAAPRVDGAAAARTFGDRYLAEMRARAEAGGALGSKVDFLVDKMLVGRRGRVGT
jgi:hypothetical protein